MPRFRSCCTVRSCRLLCGLLRRRRRLLLLLLLLLLLIQGLFMQFQERSFALHG